MLALNGVLIPLKNLKVSCSKEYKEKDLSGQSSSTFQADQGDKGVLLSVSGTLAYRDEAILTQLYELFSAKDENGDRMIYRIGNRDARLYKVREVKFTGQLRSEEHETLLAWVISFSLRENFSAAEQQEVREREQNQPEQEENNAHKQALLDAEESLSET